MVQEKEERISSDNIEPLWTVKEAAAFLQKSVRSVWKILNIPPKEPGSMPYVRIGRNPRFEPSALQEWVAMGCPPAATYNAWTRKRK